MMQPNTSTSTGNTSTLSANNFDLPSLHLLRSEIDVALKDAETHLSEFNDDSEQAPLLLDSVEVLTQLTDVLKLISLQGASELAEAIALCLKQLYDAGDNNDSARIMDISEAIMTLDRYIEFVLLQETLEPSLLLPIINKLYQHLDKPELANNAFAQLKSTSISIANPERNYQSLSSLNLDIDKLSKAYRAGLSVVLTKKVANLSDDEQKKLTAMAAACALIAAHTDTLFWQAATAAVTDIAEILPLSNARKRTLIFVEQQFHDYLPVNDNRFADLVSFASKRNHAQARALEQQYSFNRMDDQQREQMKRFLFGPNRKVTDTLNELIQSQINEIKQKVDVYTRQDDFQSSTTDNKQIASDLVALGGAMKLLGLQDATDALYAEAESVKAWQTPTPEDFDKLLNSLMVAENASIIMAKAHIPGAFNMPLHNRNISMHQLDTAYETLVAECRLAIKEIETTITGYVEDPLANQESIDVVAGLLQQVAGAVCFLPIENAVHLLSRLVKHVQNYTFDEARGINQDNLEHIADILMAVDYQLDGLEKKHPVGKQAMLIGQRSLSQLLAAA
jgi:hypothetical protein